MRRSPLLAGLSIVGVIALNVGPVGASSTHPTTTSTPLSTPLSTLRVQQILSGLGYLPLKFDFAGGKSLSGVSHPQAGSFKWRWTGVPGALRSQWRVGGPNVIEEGGLMTFERLSGLPAVTYPTLATDRVLLAAARAGKRDPQSYDYVYVSTTLPERVYLYVNGHLHYSTLANTGVAGATTELTTTPVYLRYTSTTMSGTYPNGGHYYDPGIPWVSYFLGGEALHGYIRSTYGWPQSLGCVEMPFANAKTLWPWTPIGTLVSVAVARP